MTNHCYSTDPVDGFHDNITDAIGLHTYEPGDRLRIWRGNCVKIHIKHAIHGWMIEDWVHEYLAEHGVENAIQLDTKQRGQFEAFMGQALEAWATANLKEWCQHWTAEDIVEGYVIIGESGKPGGWCFDENS